MSFGKLDNKPLFVFIRDAIKIFHRNQQPKCGFFGKLFPIIKLEFLKFPRMQSKNNKIVLFFTDSSILFFFALLFFYHFLFHSLKVIFDILLSINNIIIIIIFKYISFSNEKYFLSNSL